MDDPMTLLPPEWLPHVQAWAPRLLAALVLTTALVHLLLPIARAVERWALTTPATWDDGPARRAVEILEWAAGLSQLLLALVPRLAVGRPGAPAKDAGPKPPAGGRPPPLPVLLVLLVAVTSSASGCGASAVSVHARGATVTAASLAAVGTVVDAARDVALDRVEAEHPTRGPERDAALDAEAARWGPAGAALDAAREIVLTWIQAIDLARVAGDDGALLPELLRLAARAVLLYDRVVAVVRSLGVDDVPPLPELVRALAQGWAGSNSSVATAGGAR